MAGDMEDNFRVTLCNCSVDECGVGEITDEPRSPRRHAFYWPTGDTGYVRTVGDKSAHEGAADEASRSRDQHPAVYQSARHLPPPLLRAPMRSVWSYRRRCNDTFPGMVEPLEALLARDLDYVVECLRDELEEMAGAKLLMTGGGGFLGYYMVQALLRWNDQVVPAKSVDVTVFDNYARGVPGWLEALGWRDDLHLVRYDVRHPLPEPLPPFEYIVHAAGIASPPYYRAHPLETMDANISGLRQLLEYARGRVEAADSFRGFLFYSSSEIYGDPPADQIPTAEDYRGNVSCTGPRACYDESKRYGETLCVVFAREYGVPVTMARPFNNYGPGLKISDRRVIPDFARDVINERDIVMLSDGAPMRTFCYVADSVVGYYKVLVRGRAGEPYNIGIDQPEISMAQLAEKIAETARELLGYGGRVILGQASEDDYLVDNPMRRCPDLTKSRKELGYEPSILVDEGLRRSVSWYHYHREAEDA
jgi:UDP-glucuronate decarboxylase